METISFGDFLKVELCVGRIVNASVFADARKPACILHVDFGDELGTKKSSAQVTALYEPEVLIGKMVVAVVNFPKKQIESVMSECLSPGFTMSRARWRFAFPTKPFRLRHVCCETGNS